MICGTTVVISTVYKRGMSYKPVEVENRTLGLVLVEKSDFIPRWGQSVSQTGFHTCLFLYDYTRLPSGFLAKHLWYRQVHLSYNSCVIRDVDVRRGPTKPCHKADSNIHKVSFENRNSVTLSQLGYFFSQGRVT